jgi:hypothetical protein
LLKKAKVTPALLRLGDPTRQFFADRDIDRGLLSFCGSLTVAAARPRTI